MFVCVREGGARSIGETLSGKRLRLTRVAVKGCDGFLTAEILTRRCPDDELLAVVRRCGGTLLCAQGTVVSDALRPHIFVPQVFPRIAALRTLAEILHGAQIDPAKLCVGVDDPDGAAAAFVPALLPLCAELRVATRCTEIYDALALRAFRSSGACVIVRERSDALRACGVTLRGGAILCAGETWRCADVRLPPEYARLCPAGVERDLFAAALYERSRLRALSGCAANRVCTGTQRKTTNEVALCLRNFFIKNY